MEEEREEVRREGERERKDGKKESGVHSKFFPFSLQPSLINECSQP